MTNWTCKWPLAKSNKSHRFSNYTIRMTITTNSAMLFFFDDLIQYAFKKYHSTWTCMHKVNTVSNDLNLNLFFVQDEFEFQIIWYKTVCILNLSLKMNYKLQIEHLSTFQLHEVRMDNLLALLFCFDELIQYVFFKLSLYLNLHAQTR